MKLDAVSLESASRDADWVNGSGNPVSPPDDPAADPRDGRSSSDRTDEEEEDSARQADTGGEPDGETRSTVGRPRVEDMSGLTKAAVFILSLKEEAASSVLRCLSDEELGRVAGEIARIGVIDREAVGEVMAQFLEIRAGSEIAYEGGVDPASRLLQRTLPADRASELTELLAARRDPERFAFLSEVDAASLVACLEEECPQTIAVVLARMNSARAADVLERLPADQRKDVIRRIATLDGISEECIRLIGQVLSRHFKGPRCSPIGDRGGVKAAAEILRAAEEQGVSSFLDDLREETPELAEKVSRHLFSFKDLACFDDRFLARALKKVAMRDLAVALKNTDPKLVGKVSRNLSRRSADELRTSGASLGAVRLSEIETARSLVLERILSLDDGVRPFSSEGGRRGG